MSKPSRTHSSFIHPSLNEYRILDKLTLFSKNIYNTIIFYSAVYYKYKYKMFDDFLNELKKEKIKYDFSDCPKKEIIIKKRGKKVKKKIHNDDVLKQLDVLKQRSECFISKNIQQYIVLHLLIQKHANKNYDYIFNYAELYIEAVNIKLSTQNRDEVVKDLINDLESMANNPTYEYCMEFTDLTYLDSFVKIIYKVVLKIYGSQCKKNKVRQDKNFYDEIKDEFIKSPFKTINKDLIKVLKANVIKHPDQSIITRMAKKFNPKVHEMLPYDLTHEILGKSFSAYSSYFQALKKNPRARRPQYLDKETGRYVIPIYRSKLGIKKHCFNQYGQLISIENIKFKNDSKYPIEEYYVAIPCGEYISKNYLSIVNDYENTLVKLGNDKSGHYFYVDKEFVDIDGPENVTKAFLNKHYKLNGKYIKRDNSNIVNSGFLLIKTTKEIAETFKYLEISRDSNGNFKINFTYEIDVIKPLAEIDKIASIDLGCVNLITMYSPHDQSIIISGKPIKCWNRFYGLKVASIDKKVKKKNQITINQITKITDSDDKLRTKRTQINPNHLRNRLLTRRRNKIDDYMNKTATYVIDHYCKKNKIDTLVIGHNKRWKHKVNMRKDTKKDFLLIPHSKLIAKLEDLAERRGIKTITNEESYTSKCDALSLEDICKHADDEYSGKRIGRGLFLSGTGKTINADVNGAINIMRKALEPVSDRLKKKIRSEIAKSSLKDGCLSKNPLKINLRKELKEVNTKSMGMRISTNNLENASA